MENSSSAIGEMYHSHFSPDVMRRRPKGWTRVRAHVRLQKLCATRSIEETGDSSTPLRMTRWPIAKHDASRCHPEEAWVQRSRNTSVTCETRLSSRAGPQADEGSTAAWDHPRSVCTFRYLKGSTSAPSAERKRRMKLRLRSELHELQQTRTHGNLVFVVPVKPVHNRQSNPLFEPHLQKSRGSWTAVIPDAMEAIGP